MKTTKLSMPVAIAALVFTSAIGAVAQHDQHGQVTQPQAGAMDMTRMMEQPAKGENITEAAMMERCQEMMQQKQRMKTDMHDQDAQLTAQLTEMNRAPQDKKLGLMAALLTRMVEQRITMDARKAPMEESMMKHMMQHMQMGQNSMSQCPMVTGMKGMKGMDEKPEDAPKEQQ